MEKWRNISVLELINSSSAFNNTEEELEPIAFIIYFIVNNFILPFLAVVGVLGNTFNILSFHYGKMKSTTYVYLRFLAVTDLAQSFFYGCFALMAKGTYTYKTFSECFFEVTALEPFTNLFGGISNLLTACVTIERYIAVCHPLRYKTWQTPKIARNTSIFLIMFGGFLHIPSFFQFSCVQGSDNQYHMVLESPKQFTLVINVYNWVREITVHIIPIIALIILNTRTVITFQNISRTRRKMKSQENEEAFKTEKKLLKLLAGLTIMYFVCTLPVTLFFLVNEFCACVYITGTSVRESITIVIVCISELSNYVFTFCIYYLFNNEYRAAFNSLFNKNKIDKISKAEETSFTIG